MDFEIHHAVEILERTPGVVSAFLNGLSDGWLLADEGKGTFSAKDVLGHLISGEETDWVVRAQTILKHGVERTFEPFDRFGFREKYAGRSLAELLELFQTLRTQNLDTLRGLRLGSGQLSLEGMHPAFGRVTLSQLLATWAVHDLAHIRQIARVMAKQYAVAVGPWKEYLRVLEE